MRELKTGQVYCLNGHKTFEVAILFITEKNVLIRDRDQEELVVKKDYFREEYTFLRNK
jgi:hypothetical protein